MINNNYKALKITTVIWLITVSPFIANAQLAAINVGEKCPQQLLSHLKGLIAKSHYPGNSNKPVLIDFWASWCAPCVSALATIDTLQRTYSSKFTVLSILEKDDDKVREVLQRIFGKQGSQLTFVEKDTVLKQYFPHQTIPHYVWISQDGIVKAITSDEKAISRNIAKLLVNGPNVTISADLPTVQYDGTRALYATKQAVLKDELLYHSMVTSWRSDIGSESARGDNFIDCLNSSTLWLFQIAYGKFDLQYLDMNRVVLEGFQTKADSASIGIFSTDTLKKLWRRSKARNLFCYELMVPDSTFSNDQLFEIMQQDVNRYFFVKGLSGHLEKRKKKVVELTLINDQKSIAFSKTTERPAYYSSNTFIKMINQPVSFFLTTLTPCLKDNNTPLINATGYNDVVNIDIKNTSTIQTINESLHDYGLILKENDAFLDVLVLTKHNK